MKNVVPVTVGSRERPACDLLVVGCFEGEPEGAPEAPETLELAEAWKVAAARAAARPGWKGQEEQVVETGVETAHPAHPAHPATQALALHGLGPRRDFTWRKLAAWLTRAADAAQINGAVRLAFLLPRHAETTGTPAAERIGRLLALCDYRFDRFLSDSARRPRIERVEILPPAGEETTYALALARIGPVVAAIVFSRDLANTPANEATPAWMEARAEEMAREYGIGFSVLQGKELESRGMGGLLAVGAGSAHPPRLLRLEVGTAGPVVALVGKGITFDTGGISIKPAQDMDDMKYDKCGACSVLALARAVAELKLPLRLRVYAALAENMLDAGAYRPGDIVRFANGKTAEITNTDAEGRLVLADALSLASQEGADVLLEYSTLTGGCVVALGHYAAGLFTPDDALATALSAAAEETGERVWRLPLWPEYLEEMKGVHADLRNAASRWGSASTAAAFLSQFVGGLARWGHLDIAPVAYVSRDQNTHPGATGYGIALTIAYLRRLVGV